MVHVERGIVRQHVAHGRHDASDLRCVAVRIGSCDEQLPVFFHPHHRGQRLGRRNPRPCDPHEENQGASKQARVRNGSEVTCHGGLPEEEIGSCFPRREGSPAVVPKPEDRPPNGGDLADVTSRPIEIVRRVLWTVKSQPGGFAPQSDEKGGGECPGWDCQGCAEVATRPTDLTPTAADLLRTRLYSVGIQELAVANVEPASADDRMRPGGPLAALRDLEPARDLAPAGRWRHQTHVAPLA